MTNYTDLILEALHQAPQKIGYFVTQHLEKHHPDKEIFCVEARFFEFLRYANETGNCEVNIQSETSAEICWSWRSPSHPLYRELLNCVYSATWQGLDFEILRLTWPEGYNVKKLCWVIGDSADKAREFYREVCTWSSEVRGEVLVFQGGCWCKSPELFESIQSSTYENLILREGLKEALFEDFQQFFESKDVYERYGIPWKRGAVLLGPPGNGKSHAVKALVNRLKCPCLYVQTLKSDYGTEHDNIRGIFSRARDMAPCVLIFEDLESHIHEANRAFFLNELDGFAANEGLLTIATTNYPEKLDPAILNRPSRFDRKYNFELPRERERFRYLDWWNLKLELGVKMSPQDLEALAEKTEGFSFAYLRELVLSGMMQWVEKKALLRDCMLGQLETLHSQMKTEFERGSQSLEP